MVGSYDLNGKVAIQYMINVGAGEIARFDGLEKIAELPEVIDIQQRHFVGDIIEDTGDIKHRAGEISVLTDREPEKMRNAIRAIQERLIIEDVKGRSLVISPIDADMVYSVYTMRYGGSI